MCFLLPAVPSLLSSGSSETLIYTDGLNKGQIQSHNQYAYRTLPTVKLLVLGLFASSAKLSGVLDYQ